MPYRNRLAQAIYKLIIYAFSEFDSSTIKVSSFLIASSISLKENILFDKYIKARAKGCSSWLSSFSNSCLLSL